MSGPTYEVLALRYATRMTTKSDCYLNFHLYGEPDAELAMDYFVWLLRSRERTVVVDTGFSAPAALRRSRTLLIEPADLLAQLDVDVAAVPQLILTHAHYDHAGNVGHFGSSEVVMARREFEFWTGPYSQRMHFAALTESEDLDQLQTAREEGRLTLVAGSHKVAPGVDVIEVGGHTAGQTIVRVATESGHAVLASDAMHYYDEVALDRPFAVVADLERMYRAFDLLRDMATEPDCVVVPGHDPEVMSRFPAVSGLERFAVRIA